ncbi:hypothetical protein, partial [Akkermansia sp.]|uniref:hypothetical protein n=1 Tax=Akkermansia sp. TaxID=1872421 RepID=UPI003AB81080
MILLGLVAVILTAVVAGVLSSAKAVVYANDEKLCRRYMNKVLNLRPGNILVAELTSVQAITRASPNNASLMRISSSVARSF